MRLPHKITIEGTSYFCNLEDSESYTEDSAFNLQKYDDDSLAKLPEYKYDKLPRMERRIRLLVLKSASQETSQIDCELIEADYGNSYHIPTKVSQMDDDQGLSSSKMVTKGEKLTNTVVEESNYQERKVEYEALSWCWGDGEEDYAIRIERKGAVFKRKIRKELALALHYLRYPDKKRTIWVDSICINQNDDSERNHQVQMMSRIYTRANKVCIWLGKDDNESNIAINFIKDEVLVLKNFDTICSDKKYAHKWGALMMLMQRPWFSRRWMIQEITLGQTATIHCGSATIDWNDFAVAVELFVEVENATHRLSEVMQKDEKFRHIPGWFDHVSELGASLLVQATGKVFRTQRLEAEAMHHRSITEGLHTVDPLERRSLLNLEHLVTTMFIFQTSEPRDVIYSLLAISRDASASAKDSIFSDPTSALLIRTGFSSFLEAKPFEVDYGRAYSDVCQKFVRFSVERAYDIDPVQALDILCRPWSLEPPKKKPEGSEQLETEKTETKSTVAEAKIEEDWNLCKSEDWLKWKKMMNTRGPTGNVELPLPSWVISAKLAPFGLFHHAGSVEKTGRVNADPLVGTPSDGHKNYSAAQARPLNLKAIRFRKRQFLQHYSLYVKGFIFDEVVEVTDASQNGYIPASWIELGNWKEPESEYPPDSFWRTLVADRGRDNRNPPYYFARACRESAIKGGLRSGGINTKELVNNERNSIIAEFCRRVQAVIWNRRLFKTKAGILGLGPKNVEKGDKLGIIYGCTVPVILREREKKREDVPAEKMEDFVESIRALIQRWRIILKRKAVYKEKGGKLDAEDMAARDTANARLRMMAERNHPSTEAEKKEKPNEPKEKPNGQDVRLNVLEERPRQQEKEDKHKQDERQPNGEKELGSDAEDQRLSEQKEDGSNEQKAETPIGPTHITGWNAEESEVKPADRREISDMMKNQADADEKDLFRYYHLVGDSYVHGMMDGEALRQKFYRDIPDQTLELR
ncbi:heterokaryon incompatibility protein-domain-containing protein [Nemania sp. FL0916]|nr:heterokaryon incompatibility protein-domain-containing protein [Nemania sp. FL0916]